RSRSRTSSCTSCPSTWRRCLTPARACPPTRGAARSRVSRARATERRLKSQLLGPRRRRRGPNLSAVGCLVVKLGSSIVADGRGQVRADVLAGICDQLAELHHARREVIVVTSGAIARGMGVMSLPVRPRTIDELQAASAVGQGKLYQVYDELLRARGVPTAQVLLTFFDISARTHYLNARQTLRKLLEWRVVPVINENDT